MRKFTLILETCLLLFSNLVLAQVDERQELEQTAQVGTAQKSSLGKPSKRRISKNQSKNKVTKQKKLSWGLGLRLHDFQSLSARIWQPDGVHGYQIAAGWRATPVSLQLAVLGERVQRVPKVLRIDGAWFDGVYGGGVIIGKKNDLGVLIHGMVGVLIESKKQPLEFTISLSPRVSIIPMTYFNFEVGISLHRMF